MNIEKELKSMGIAQYRRASHELRTKKYYWRGRSYRPNEGLPGHVDILIFENEEIKTLCHNTTAHRAGVLLRAWKNGTIIEVDPFVLENYKTNGYMTRRGLFRSVRTDKMVKVARSHADYLGNETGNSTIDHCNRVAMR